MMFNKKEFKESYTQMSQVPVPVINNWFCIIGQCMYGSCHTICLLYVTNNVSDTNNTQEGTMF